MQKRKRFMQRIVSLLPSSTEIVYALGCGEGLVGRSHECDYPKAVRALPACTAPKFDPDGTSYEIDQRVKAILQEAISVYRVDAELLDELAPDLIITQSQCEVCAVSLKDVEEAVYALVRSRPQIVSLAPNALADVWRDIECAAQALGVVERGAALLASLKGRLDALAERTGKLTERPRVACIEWFAPLMAAGNWMPELVELAGGENLFGAEGAHSPWMEWQELKEAEPDCIVLMPCGFDLARTRSEMAALSADPVWPTLKAVQAGQVFLTDGNQYFNRPGPRLVESVEILTEILHGFNYGHQGNGWQRC
jgi:iron complex transport system substrate-binding protein